MLDGDQRDSCLLFTPCRCPVSCFSWSMVWPTTPAAKTTASFRPSSYAGAYEKCRSQPRKCVRLRAGGPRFLANYGRFRGVPPLRGQDWPYEVGCKFCVRPDAIKWVVFCFAGKKKRKRTEITETQGSVERAVRSGSGSWAIPGRPILAVVRNPGDLTLLRPWPPVGGRHFQAIALRGGDRELQAIPESIPRRSDGSPTPAIQCRSPRRWDDNYSVPPRSRAAAWDNTPAARSVHGHPSPRRSRCPPSFQCA